jgi:regulatory protein
LHQKLLSLGGGATDVETALQELSDRHLQSDSRFAEAFIRSRASRGQGPKIIEAELQRRGVESELAEEALACAGYDWAACARDVRHKRFGQTLPSLPREQARQLRFLQYRGFTSSQAIAAIKGRDSD